MEIRDLRKPVSRRTEAARFASLVFLALFLLAGGCGAPGEPTPPTPPVPAAVTDLAAHQAGDGVQLIFTLPAKTITGDRLALPPAVEIVRGMPKPMDRRTQNRFASFTRFRVRSWKITSRKVM